ncbi:hypothetical protein GCM10009733_062340 [Nonomuraea maheshkhaliensis]|uniref:Uncharacterized protein n=1 Tax=Nonomuraea maheshkhaliensis TaxID=419590 RepID=A0ABP4RL94_9ACTN
MPTVVGGWECGGAGWEESGGAVAGQGAGAVGGVDGGVDLRKGPMFVGVGGFGGSR